MYWFALFISFIGNKNILLKSGRMEYNGDLTGPIYIYCKCSDRYFFLLSCGISLINMMMLEIKKNYQ